MENIKTQLLQKLQDIHTISDPGMNEEHLTLCSSHFDEESQNRFELIIELIANKDRREEPGNYHNDRNDFEGRGFYYIVESISIQQIYIFKNLNEEAEFKITNKEAEAAIKI